MAAEFGKDDEVIVVSVSEMLELDSVSFTISSDSRPNPGVCSSFDFTSLIQFSAVQRLFQDQKLLSCLLVSGFLSRIISSLCWLMSAFSR